MWRKFVTVPSNDFLERFLPNPVGLTPGNYAGAFNKMPREGDREESLYEPFVCLHATLTLCPGYKCVSTANAPDRDEKFKQKVDAALFLEEEAPTDGRQHWAQQRISFEFKRYSGRDDPFEEEKEGYEHDTSYGNRTRGQAIAYAAEIFARQFRTFCFTVLILGNCARIVRWDRSGAAFTEKFNYKRNPEILGEFLWRFSHHEAKEQGYDESATLVTEGSEDYVLMKQYAETKLESGDYVREYFKTSYDAGWPLWRLKVDDDARTASGVSTAPRSTYYLVGKPHFLADGMVGRGTRGYVALDCQTCKFVFLKDAWRVDHIDIEKEGDVLRKLYGERVENVPTLVCHGDVLDQQTLTQVIWEEVNGPTPEARRPLKKHVHYRLVVEEVGIPVNEFAHGFELVSIIYDCLTAHQQAFEKLRLLHRDVSIGNVMIVERFDGIEFVRIGYLCDWELSKSIPDGDATQVARQPDRTGTWQFMSALSLQNPYKPITLQDDLEAFFHLVLYMAVRFLPHNIGDANVGTFIYRYFDDADPLDRQFYVCGEKKWSTIQSGLLTFKTKPITFGDDANYPMNDLLETLLPWFSAYYAVIGHDHPQLVKPPEPAADPQNSVDDPLDNMPQRLRQILQINSVKDGMHRPRKTTRNKDAQMQENRKLAQSLNGHSEICSLFRTMLADPKRWQSHDKTLDKLPKNYNLAKEVQGVRDSTRHSLGCAGLSHKMNSLTLDATPEVEPVVSYPQEQVCTPPVPEDRVRPRSVAHSDLTECIEGPHLYSESPRLCSEDPHFSVSLFDLFEPAQLDPAAQPPPQEDALRSTSAQSSPFWELAWGCTVQ
ncbi:hypothetical protein BKA93DRAFT_895462 [Sparassis latifolia]